LLKSAPDFEFFFSKCLKLDTPNGCHIIAPKVFRIENLIADVAKLDPRFDAMLLNAEKNAIEVKQDAMTVVIA
jgi:hypothetical protein